MKKYFVLLLALIAALAFTSCSDYEEVGGNSESAAVTTNETTESDSTVQITSRGTVAATTEKIKIKEETVSVSKKRASTDPTDPASASSKTKKKKKNSQLDKLPTQGETRAGTYVAVTTAPNGSFSVDDLTFIFEGAYIELGDDIEDVEAILGDNNSVIEVSKARTAYEYDNLTVITVTRGDEETVEKITVTTDKLATKKGAKVGMYATQLRTVYGEPTKKTATAYTYTGGEESLVFEYTNNIVTSYSYVLTN